MTESEEAEDALTGHSRFDIGLLADRLVHVTDWVQKQPDLSGLALGCFGSSTGAAETRKSRNRP